MTTVASTATAPRILSWPGNGAPDVVSILPVASAAGVWKKGEFGYDASNKITPVTATVGDAQYVFLDTRDTRDDDTKARVARLTAGTRILIRNTASGTDGVETTPTRGTAYGVIVHGANANVTVLDTDNTTTPKFEVVKKGSELNEYEYLAATSPGFVEVVKLA